MLVRCLLSLHCVCGGGGGGGCLLSLYCVCLCVYFRGCLLSLYCVYVCVCVCVTVFLINLIVISSLEIILLMKREMVALS